MHTILLNFFTEGRKNRNIRFASEISKILYFFGGCGIMKSRDWEDMPDSPFRLDFVVI